MSLDFDSARMHNPDLNEEHDAWREQLRRFIDKEIVPNVDTWDEQGFLPAELWGKAAAFGLLGLGYPAEYGGTEEGIDLWHRNIVSEELSRTSLGGLPSTLLSHGIGLPPVVAFGSEALKAEVIPLILAGEKRIALAITEPSGGSDVANLQTTARREGDYYIVNGSKTFISGGMGANWFTTGVRTGGDGMGGVSVLVIPADAEGVSRTPLDKKQGWWCSDTATIYFDNVKVPAVNLLAEEGHGFLVIANNFNGERMGMCVMMEASARVCLEEAVAWAQERKTFGKRLADHQVIRHKIAEMKQQINACQAMINHCTREIIAGRAVFGDIALLKVQCSQTMEFCAREAMQILGGIGYMRGNRVERIYREVRVNAIGGGSEEIMRDLAARQYQL
ncbi:acyl-CoA dehydrogenase [Halioglobus japonicus]|uniref:Acyl-CoA dehydrogenase n=2 Tax=Halioglobus TaxID=1217416 RepID=A0AAP8MD49_9GAMM|nr:acyl-CoA dehydrogenase family protein [Halioglobus japonicus]AQA17680.1 acyl-CoA dehydrogenase [Halioglobus japonicus]PLW85628.1 acyl-CoA dehydrogenase [Halioglobus japonicus]GHD16629.1 acyl-CoA dehydrogenase [Halioglobus japonicus]